LTVAPEIATPAAVLTSALMVVEVMPSAVRLATPDVTVTLPTVGATAPPTAYPVEAVRLSTVGATVEGTELILAETESAPDGALLAGESVVVATPLMSVKAVVGVKVPYVEFVLKAITAPEIPAPAPSFNVAVTVPLTPVEIELGARAIEKVGSPVTAPPALVLRLDVLSLQPAANAAANRGATNILANGILKKQFRICISRSRSQSNNYAQHAISLIFIPHNRLAQMQYN